MVLPMSMDARPNTSRSTEDEFPEISAMPRHHRRYSRGADMTQTKSIRLGELAFTVDLAGPENATPVLLLHGFPETRHMWRHQIEALAIAGYRAIAPDQRGYSSGARPAEESAYATDLIVADAIALMDAMGAAKFHLVGHDWGGQISWLIAARHPQRLRSLSILSRPHPEAFIRAMKEDSAQAERSRHHRAFREADAIARMRAAELKPLRNALQGQGVSLAAADVYIRALMEPGAIEAAMNWYRAGSLAASAVPKISVSTLYVWGTEDATVGRVAASLTRDHVQASYRFVEMEGAGHFLVDQFPDQTTALLLAHISAH
ncbi:MAG: alpha/beta hydrolase [Betaproteobacteria bacterium]|nr:alpha/beta hydrolase [Betaproteobacteria bacterium]